MSNPLSHFIKTSKPITSKNNFMNTFLGKDKTSKSMAMITGKDLGIQEHIGAKKFDPTKTRPIKNQGFSKPIGGFWTSSIVTKPNPWKDPEVGSTEWRTWMKNNWEDRFREDARKESMKLQPIPDAKIFQIANKQDLEDLYKQYPSNYKGFKKEVDWEKASKDLDAINITQSGHHETRLPNISNYNEELDTYPWDAESTVWFKPAFKEIEDDKTSKQYFTPSRDSTEFTAAQKFGGRNIKRLKKLGSGRDRDVYALDEDKVLKIAKNPKGLIQNTGERDLDYLKHIKQYEAGKDYVVMQRADKPGKATTALLKPLRKFYQPDFDQHNEKLQEALINADLDDVRSFDTGYGDLKAKRNWGEIEGRPVIIDGGIFTGSSLPPHVPPPQWATQEWREVQTSRRAFRNKGAEDKDWEMKPGRYSEWNERLADFPIINKDESPNKMIKTDTNIFTRKRNEKLMHKTAKNNYEEFLSRQKADPEEVNELFNKLKNTPEYEALENKKIGELERSYQWNLDHPEYKKEWVQKNPKKVKEYAKEWRQKNPEKYEQAKESTKIWRQNNPERVQEYKENTKIWKQNNPERVQEHRERYEEKHPDRFKTKKREETNEES